MQKKSAKYTFAIPEKSDEKVLQADGVVVGQKIEKSFDYEVCDNEDEANKIIAEKKWSVVGMVNDSLKANARSNAYQTSLARYRPSEVPAEDVKERMIRDYVRLGVNEEIARKQVEALLAATNQ